MNSNLLGGSRQRSAVAVRKTRANAARATGFRGPTRLLWIIRRHRAEETKPRGGRAGTRPARGGPAQLEPANRKARFPIAKSEQDWDFKWKHWTEGVSTLNLGLGAFVPVPIGSASTAPLLLSGVIYFRWSIAHAKHSKNRAARANSGHQPVTGHGSVVRVGRPGGCRHGKRLWAGGWQRTTDCF